MELDGGVVRGHHGTVLEHGDALRPEQHLGRACLERVGPLAEHVPQQHLRELVHEERRHVDALAANSPT